MFNEGFVSSTGATQDRDLAADAVWLAGVVATAVPHEAEAWGLAALLTIQHARAARPVLAVRRARAAPPPGPRALGPRRRRRAARSSSSAPPPSRSPAPTSSRPRSPPCTPTAPSWEETDWLQIVLLYDVLAAPRPLPGRRAQPGRRAGPARHPRPRAPPARHARRPARVVPPLPRGPRRAAHRPRPPRRGRRGQPHRARAHRQRRRAPAAHDPAAPAAAGRRQLTREGSAVSRRLAAATSTSVRSGQ